LSALIARNNAPNAVYGVNIIGTYIPYDYDPVTYNHSAITMTMLDIANTGLVYIAHCRKNFIRTIKVISPPLHNLIPEYHHGKQLYMIPEYQGY